MEITQDVTHSTYYPFLRAGDTPAVFFFFAKHTPGCRASTHTNKARPAWRSQPRASGNTQFDSAQRSAFFKLIPTAAGFVCVRAWLHLYATEWLTHGL